MRSSRATAEKPISRRSAPNPSVRRGHVRTRIRPHSSNGSEMAPEGPRRRLRRLGAPLQPALEYRTQGESGGNAAGERGASGDNHKRREEHASRKSQTFRGNDNCEEENGRLNAGRQAARHGYLLIYGPDESTPAEILRQPVARKQNGGCRNQLRNGEYRRVDHARCESGIKYVDRHQQRNAQNKPPGQAGEQHRRAQPAGTIDEGPEPAVQQKAVERCGFDSSQDEPPQQSGKQQSAAENENRNDERGQVSKYAV